MDAQAFLNRSTYFQLGTIGTEIGRASSWRDNPSYGNPDECINRATNYINCVLNAKDCTFGKRRELARLKEVMNDWYYGENLYHTTQADWDRYFLPFSIAANHK